MTNWLEHRVDGKTLYVVSDLHMGDGTRKDNFAEYCQRFEQFLGEVVEKDPNSCLVLAGDVFEFWQSPHGDIVRAHLELLKRLVRSRSVFLVGNHDIDLEGFVGLPVSFPLIECLATELGIDRGGREIRICHGHEFDKYNDPRKLLWLGKIATVGAGQVEMWLGTKIGDETTESLLEKIFRGIQAWLARRYRSWFGKTAGEKVEAGKKIDEVRHALDKYRQDHERQLLVAGHTHRAGWYGDWYVNTGCWQSQQAHYAKISPDGQVSLHKWPGQEVDQTQLWPSGADPDGVVA